MVTCGFVFCFPKPTLFTFTLSNTFVWGHVNENEKKNTHTHFPHVNLCKQKLHDKQDKCKIWHDKCMSFTHDLYLPNFERWV